MNITVLELRQLRGKKTVKEFAEYLQCSSETIHRFERQEDDTPISDRLQKRVDIYKAGFKPVAHAKKYYATYTIAERTQKLRERIIEVYKEKIKHKNRQECSLAENNERV